MVGQDSPNNFVIFPRRTNADQLMPPQVIGHRAKYSIRWKITIQGHDIKSIYSLLRTFENQTIERASDQSIDHSVTDLTWAASNLHWMWCDKTANLPVQCIPTATHHVGSQKRRPTTANSIKSIAQWDYQTGRWFWPGNHYYTNYTFTSVTEHSPSALSHMHS